KGAVPDRNVAAAVNRHEVIDVGPRIRLDAVHVNALDLYERAAGKIDRDFEAAGLVGGQNRLRARLGRVADRLGGDPRALRLDRIIDISAVEKEHDVAGAKGSV